MRFMKEIHTKLSIMFMWRCINISLDQFSHNSMSSSLILQKYLCMLRYISCAFHGIVSCASIWPYAFNRIFMYKRKITRKSSSKYFQFAVYSASFSGNSSWHLRSNIITWVHSLNTQCQSYVYSLIMINHDKHHPIILNCFSSFSFVIFPLW